MSRCQVRPRSLVSLLLLLLCAPVHPAQAEVISQADHGFMLRQVVHLAAPPAQAYQALIDVGSWWHPDHTYSGDSANLSLDARPGGCWCEKLPEDGFVKHLEVVSAAPGEMLRLAGGLGPLAEEGLAGSITIRLTAKDDGTRLEFVYRVGGYVENGAGKWAEPVDFVWDQALSRLQRLVATGSPDAD